MTADLAVWQDEHLLDHRRRLRTAMCVSLAIHGLMFAVFAAAPPAPVVDVPSYVAVDLVAAPAPRPAPAPAQAPARAPTAPKPQPAAEPPLPAPTAPKPPPAAEPAPPAPPPPSAPPVAKAPVQALPEETPGKIRKAKPEPSLSKAKPAPEVPRETLPRRRRGEPQEQVSLEDLLAEEGPDEATAMLRREDEAPEADTSSSGTPGPGAQISPEQLAWDRQVIAQVSRRFVDLARYRGRGLMVRFRIRVGANGELVGEPALLSSSGDLDFDRNALSAVMVAGPFPPPLTPEPRVLSLRPEAASR